MNQSRKQAPSQNQQSDQWTQTAHGMWLPNSMRKQDKRQRIVWTERQVAGKMVWDWMSLLLIPLLIGIGTIWVTNRQTDAQNALNAQLHQSDTDNAQQARWDDLLNQYRDGIDTLLLSNGLRQSHPDDDVSEIAHARTLDVLAAIDPSRRGSVIIYLSNLKLVQGEFNDPSKNWHQHISVSLSFADLTGADLSNTDLTGADLSFADLTGADLTSAHLNDAYLNNAHLNNAHLNNAYLSGVHLSSTDFSGAYLSGAYLSDDYLPDAHLTLQQLHNVNSLSNTTLPNGLHCKSDNSIDLEIRFKNRDTCLREAGYP